MSKERRKYIRVRLAKPLKLNFRIIGSKGSIKMGGTFSKDISGGGVLIDLPAMKQEILEGLVAGKNSVVLEFRLPRTRAKLRIRGKVQWVDRKETPKGKTHGVGIQFIGMREEDREKLLQYMLDLVLE